MKQGISPAVAVVAIVIVVVLVAVIGYFTVFRKGADAPTSEESPTNDLMQKSLNPNLQPQPAGAGADAGSG